MSELTWYPAAALTDFATQSCVPVIVDDQSLLLVRWHDKFYAFLNNCPHENLPMTGANIEDDELVCPHHGARFCVFTGAVMAPPAFEDLETFSVKLENNKVYIGIKHEF
jgi:3-phenylpropionate/trans-cinnamate dioxygenase ferredoxin subunit